MGRGDRDRCLIARDQCSLPALCGVFTHGLPSPEAFALSCDTHGAAVLVEASALWEGVVPYHYVELVGIPWGGSGVGLWPELDHLPFLLGARELIFFDLFLGTAMRSRAGRSPVPGVRCTLRPRC